MTRDARRAREYSRCEGHRPVSPGPGVAHHRGLYGSFGRPTDEASSGFGGLDRPESHRRTGHESTHRPLGPHRTKHIPAVLESGTLRHGTVSDRSLGYVVEEPLRSISVRPLSPKPGLLNRAPQLVQQLSIRLAGAAGLPSQLDLKPLGGRPVRRLITSDNLVQYGSELRRVDGTDLCLCAKLHVPSRPKVKGDLGSSHTGKLMVQRSARLRHLPRISRGPVAVGSRSGDLRRRQRAPGGPVVSARRSAPFDNDAI